MTAAFDAILVHADPAFTRLEELGRVSIGVGGWAVAATAFRRGRREKSDLG